jgi:hypothetical protein
LESPVPYSLQVDVLRFASSAAATSHALACIQSTVYGALAFAITFILFRLIGTSVIEDKNTLQRLRNDLESLHAAAQRHQDRLAIAFSIREEYLNLLPTLYAGSMRPTVVERRCSELPTHRGVTCSGPAIVRKDARQATLVLDSKGRISSNRRRYADLVDEKPVPDGFVPCVLRLQRLAQGLADAVAGGRLPDS